MITKGEAFTFMYETRNKSTGALVPDSANSHTIKVFYQNNGTWTGTTIISAQTPSGTASSITTRPIFIGSDTGLYLCQISSTYTNCEHVIVSVTSSNTDVIIPIQQFYPVGDVTVNSTQATAFSAVADVSGIANNVSTLVDRVPTTALTASDVASEVWTGSYTRSLSTTPPTATAIADEVWGGSRSIRKLTSETIDDNSSPSKTLALASNVPDTTAIKQAVWNNTSGNRQLTSSTLANTDGSNSSTSLSTGSFPTVATIASNVWSEATRQLTSNALDNSSGASLALSGESNVSVDDGSGQSESITTSAIASAVLAGIPDAVWSMTVNGDAYSRMARIADYVWGRNPGDDDRALTTNVLDAYSSPTLALSTEVDTGTDFDPSTIQFPDKDQIATAVWNYGKASGVANKNFRSLSNTAIVSSDGTTSKYIGTLSSSTNTIDAAVWASTDKTLSSADIDDGTTIATTTDIPSIENLTDMLTKIFGVLCHWELSGDNIIVKNDSGDTILTIPTVKDKFGDIIQMDGVSEEQL